MHGVVEPSERYCTISNIVYYGNLDTKEMVFLEPPEPLLSMPNLRLSQHPEIADLPFSLLQVRLTTVLSKSLLKKVRSEDDIHLLCKDKNHVFPFYAQAGVFLSKITIIYNIS